MVNFRPIQNRDKEDELCEPSGDRIPPGLPQGPANPQHGLQSLSFDQCHPVLLFFRCLGGSPSRWEIGRGLFPLASLWEASPTCPFRSTGCNDLKHIHKTPAGINTTSPKVLL